MSPAAPGRAGLGLTERAQQSGLAPAGFATDEHDPAPSCSVDRGEALLERGQFGVALVEVRELAPMARPERRRRSAHVPF